MVRWAWSAAAVVATVTHLLQPKAVALLRWAALESYDARRARWVLLLTQWPEKALCQKLEDLGAKGYVDYGVSLRGCWLTDRGWAKLEEARAAAA